MLILDKPLLSITTLTNGDSTGTVITSTGYWLEPRNDPPYRAIRLRSGKSWQFDDDGEVSVDAPWGFSTTVPADIQQATLRQATYLYRQRDASIFGVTATPELGTIQVKFGMPDDVVEILRSGGYLNSFRVI